jgi:hypothetical protein
MINSIVNPANKVSKLTREQRVSLQEQSKLERSGGADEK